MVNFAQVALGGDGWVAAGVGTLAPPVEDQDADVARESAWVEYRGVGG